MTNHKNAGIKPVSRAEIQQNVSEVDEFNLAVFKEWELYPGAH